MIYLRIKGNLTQGLPSIVKAIYNTFCSPTIYSICYLHVDLIFIQIEDPYRTASNLFVFY